MFLNKTKKGQALLIVIVVSTLALLIMLSLADRIILSRVNIQRSEEFDRSISVAENVVNEVIKVLDVNPVIAADCLKNVNTTTVTTNYALLECAALNTVANARVYGRRAGSANLEVTPNFPLTHLVGDNLTTGKPTSGVVAICDAASNGKQFMITRVIIENNMYKSEKGVYTCGTNLTYDPKAGNVKLFSSNSSSQTQVSGPGVAAPANRNTLLIRARLMQDSGSARIQLGTNDSTGKAVTTTSKYEFLVTGLGELGSDSVVTFERPVQGNSTYSQGFLDYVYFGEDD